MSLNCRENIVNDLSTLESLIVTTKDYCMQKDFSCKKHEKDLSYERNNYINNLNLALSIINNIKTILE